MQPSQTEQKSPDLNDPEQNAPEQDNPKSPTKPHSEPPPKSSNPPSSTTTKAPSKHALALRKAYTKSHRRRAPTSLLPSPHLTHPIALEPFTTFTTHLRTSTRILALLGAGLSASSGIPTFRGAANSLWRNHNVTDLATPEGFAKDPVLVTEFYNERRRAALAASPNRGHVALARLAAKLSGRKTDGKTEDARCGFMAISQNIDGLSERAGHGEALGLVNLHGSLHGRKCSRSECDFREDLRGSSAEGVENAEHAAKPSPSPQSKPDSDEQISDPRAEDASSTTANSSNSSATLPLCPKCTSPLRPTVVWFGEPIAEAARDRIHAWLDAEPKVDLMLVVGTTAQVYPAAAYVHAARVQGARIAVFNTEEAREEERENPITKLRDGVDWFFRGDAAEVLPEVLRGEIGEIHDEGREKLRKAKGRANS